MNSYNNNYFIKKNIETEVIKKWDKSTPGSYATGSTFLGYDSLLFVNDLSGRIISFNIISGKKIGELKYDGGIEQSSLILGTFLHFIVNEQKKDISTLVTYDIVNGRELRSIELTGKFTNEMFAIDDYFYAVSDFGMVYKFTQWGTIEWVTKLQELCYSNPAADSSNLFIPTRQGDLLKLDIENGEILNTWQISNGFESGLSVNGNYLFIGDNNGIFYSINKHNGQIIWKFNTNSKIVQTPSLDAKNVYIGNLSGECYSINQLDGKLNWKYKSEGLINIPPLVFENVIVQPDLFKYVYFIDKKTGKEKNRINFDTRCRTMPFYFNGFLFLGVDKGDIFCYKISELN